MSAEFRKQVLGTIYDASIPSELQSIWRG